MTELNKRNLCLTPWCNVNECEKAAKERSKIESLQLSEQGEEEEVLTGAAKTLCIPFEQEPIEEGTKCFHCEKEAKVRALWGRTY
jgi:prolyl-tRNA synthetase